jgi:plasmid stabilization system protein ParE
MRIRWTVPSADDLGSIKGYLQEHHPQFAEPTVRTIYQRIQTTQPDIATLYRRAFEEFGPSAVWSSRPVPDPTVADALAIIHSLRVEGDLNARRLAEQIERLCRAAGSHPERRSSASGRAPWIADHERVFVARPNRSFS